MKKQIHVRVSPIGEITVEAQGFKGQGCEAATKAIEAALGTTTNRTRKPEFWQRDANTRENQQLGGGGG
jgi:hypothetical protein